MAGMPWSRPMTGAERAHWRAVLRAVVGESASFRGGPSRRCDCGLVRFGPCRRADQAMEWNRLQVEGRCRGVVES